MAKKVTVKKGGDADAQGYLPDMAPKRIEALHRKALDLRKLRDDKGTLTEKEKNATAKLCELMREHAQDLPTVNKNGTQTVVYAVGTIKVEYSHADKIKVRVNEQPAGEPDEGEGDCDEAEVVEVSESN